MEISHAIEAIADPFPSALMSVESVEKKLAVILVAANARNSLASSTVNLAHLGYLKALLVIVRLVDTNSVDPEVATSVPTGLSEHVLTVAAHSHPLPVDEDDR